MAKESTPGPGRLKAAPQQGAEAPPEAREALQRERQPAPPAPKGLPATDEFGNRADRPPVPPVAAPAPAPRLVSDFSRAPAGTQRYKVRCDAPHGPHPTRYVLVPRGDRKAAEDHYLEATGVKALLDALGADAPTPKLVVTALPD